MKKISIVSAMSFLFLIICSTVAYFLRYVSFNSAIVPLVVGVVVLILSGVLAIFAKQKNLLNIICFVLSAIALGFLIRAWYIFRGFDNSFLTILLVSLACIVYLWIFYLLTFIPFFEKHFNWFFWIYFILSFIAYILVIIFTKTTFVSTFGYYMIIEMAFIFALCAESKNLTELVRSITISTYSVFIVAIIIILFMSGGDGFDADFSGFSLNEKKTPKNQRVDLE